MFFLCVFAFFGGVFVLLVFFLFFPRASAIFFWGGVNFGGGTTPKRGIPALLVNGRYACARGHAPFGLFHLTDHAVPKLTQGRCDPS